MSLDIQEIKQQAEQSTQQALQEAVAPASNPVEDAARVKGWRPLDEYEGDPANWRSAELFMALEPFYDEIKSLKRSKKDLEFTVQELSKHTEKVRESEFQRAVNYLKSEKKKALVEGDVDRVVELDDKLDLVKEAQRESKVVQREYQAQGEHPDFTSFKQNNGWYTQDRKATVFADKLGVDYAQSNPHLDYGDVLRYVESEVRKEFPDLFQVRKRAPAAVDSGHTSGKSPAKKEVELSQEERKIMEAFARRIPGFSRDQYLADVKRIKGIE